MKSTLKYFPLLIVKLVLFVNHSALAAPKMDSAIGTGKPLMATVLPDHEDPNLYYVFPQTSDVVMKPDGKMDFLYIETRKYGLGRYHVEAARLGVGIVPSISSPALEAKVVEIKATNPNAKFAVVTAFESTVSAKDENTTYFQSGRCPEVNGPLEVPIYCDLDLNPAKATAFRKILASTSIRVLHLEYKFYGFADGKIQEFAYSVPIKVGSLAGGAYFFDQNGNPI